MNVDYRPSVKLRVAIFIKLIFVSLLLMASPSVVIAGQDADRVNAGLKLVETFYSDMLNDKPTQECSPIFEMYAYPKKERLTRQIKIWEYVRENRDLFLTSRYISGEFHKPEDFFTKARKTFSYYNPLEGEPVSSGHLYITLSSTTAKGGKDGIYKEVAFPIVLDESTNSWKIQFYGMKINGVLIDSESEFIRDFDLWKRLGFKQ